MKRIWVALLVFSMLGGAVSANAISFKRKKTKKKESVEKEKTAYDKLFSSNHSKAEGFITVHKVKEKVYFELPLSLLKRDMLLGSAVTEISDNRNAIIGSKPTEPIHFRFEKLNNKICLSAIQTDNVSGDNDNRLKTAIAFITFVGMYADTSPACVSMIGSAVKEPPPNLSERRAARSNSLECK